MTPPTPVRIQTLTPDQMQKIASDIAFLSALLHYAKSTGWRIVVSGGYGMDGFFGCITRYHRDVDVIVYGMDSHDNGEKKMRDWMNQSMEQAKMTIKNTDFYREIDIEIHGVGSYALYYVQTQHDPFVTIDDVIRLDGNLVSNTPDHFPHPVPGIIGELFLEVQDQNQHLADIYRKLTHTKNDRKFDQDIANLRLVTDGKVVTRLRMV
jgi:hypothetical protein